MFRFTLSLTACGTAASHHPSPTASFRVCLDQIADVVLQNVEDLIELGHALGILPNAGVDLFEVARHELVGCVLDLATNESHVRVL
jgi:hypothetical protein